mgnify:CR=1 FL=1
MIHVECDADQTLVMTLGVPRKEIKHVHAKGNVCNRLEKGRRTKGLIDEDPLSLQPRYVRRLRLLSDEKQIKLYHDKIAENYLIMLCPRLEEWVLKVAREVGIDISEYGLPDDADKLHTALNIKSKLENFEKLIEDIKERSGMLKTLEGFIRGSRAE